MYGYGLIGNCHSSALIRENSEVAWLCWPRPDSEPVFGSLLDREGGRFAILPPDSVTDLETYQYYVENTNILVTELKWNKGTCGVRVTDFFPRFEQMGRIYRPAAMYRKVEKILGNPRIRVLVDPVSGWSKTRPQKLRGNSHIRYEIREEEMRIATNFSLTLLDLHQEVTLQEPIYLALTWGVGVEDDLIDVYERFYRATKAYWETWVKHCSIPTLFQKEVIRSALVLKLHCFEETGAILAALTTSLPEIVGQQRNWDYRFCWLRDAFYVLTAFRNLGHFEEMEGFLKYVINIAFEHGDELKSLGPVYRLDLSLPLPEKVHENWEGFKGSSPVRSDNQAAEHVQNDVYGELILALSPVYMDERFRSLRSKELELLLRELGRHCLASLNKKDAGLWEIRDGWQVHTFTHLMSWAGLYRLYLIEERNPDASFLGSLNLASGVNIARQAVLSAVDGEGALVNGPTDPTPDASLVQAAMLRFPHESVSAATVDAICRHLEILRGSDPRAPEEATATEHETSSVESPEKGTGFFYRYMRQDDFGRPESGFVICSFWVIQALCKLGRQEEAHRIMKATLRSANKLGLLSEHYDPFRKMQLGNFPQAYSHVGLINSAFAISPNWDEYL